MSTVTGDDDGHGEIILAGGTSNAGLVSRVGGTVRRPQRATGPAVHALLAHLERVGFDGAPRLRGVDDQGREVLTYIEGEAAIAPYPAWALTEKALASVARLLRRYHDAVASFDPAGHSWPRSVPAAFTEGIVSHNDPNLNNVIFADGEAVALIDFDLAAPGSVAWDVACAARLWSPLRDDGDVPRELEGRPLDRLRQFADAYGLPARDRARLVDAVLPTCDWAYDVVRDALAAGHETFDRVWREGGRLRADRTRRWIAAHDEEMRTALAAG